MGPVKMNCKSEARSTKHETNAKSECSNVQNPVHQDFWQFGFGHFDFGNSDLFRISYL